MADLHSHEDCSKNEEDQWVELERVYKEKSNEEESLVKWFTENVNFYLSSATAEGGNLEVSSKKYSVLSFGCGNGTKDQAMLKAISSRLPEVMKLVYHAVDPAAKELERFKEAVKNDDQGSCFQNIEFGFFAQTYENYMEHMNKETPSKANLIMFIDSLCHFSSTTEDAVVHCYENVLAQNGVILVTLWNDRDFWFKLREIYEKDKSSKRTAEEGNDYLTIQEVEEIVRKRGWKFKFFSPGYQLDVSECFNPHSQDGKYLLDCLAYFSNVKKEVDADPQKMLKFLKDSTLKSENAQLLEGKHGVLMIYKQ